MTDLVAGVLPLSALDERIAIVGTSGSGKTYAAKGMVELLLGQGARVCVVDPLGVWWGLRAGVTPAKPGFPVVVFGGRHADVPLSEDMGRAMAHVVGKQSIACVIDLSELGSSAARRRFMSAFAEALFDANTEPLHLALDEADLWCPQRPGPDAMTLLGRMEEIVRRGRVRGFIPWLITQRPAVVHKDVLSQADILVMMKLTSSQDREAVGGWIEGQADRVEGKKLLAALPRLKRGSGYVWAPADEVLAETTFPTIATFDSSRTPQRGERVAAPGARAEVDLPAIMAQLEALGVPDPDGDKPAGLKVAVDLAAMRARYEALLALLETERQAAARWAARCEHLEGKLDSIHAITVSNRGPTPQNAVEEPQPVERAAVAPKVRRGGSDAGLHPAALKLLTALIHHGSGRFTWQQAGTLAVLKASGGHFNSGRQQLRERGLVLEEDGFVKASPTGIALLLGGEPPPTPPTKRELLELWCSRLPSPAPEMLRTLAQAGPDFSTVGKLASILGKKPTGGHWNSGIAVLRKNGLIEIDRGEMRVAELFR